MWPGPRFLIRLCVFAPCASCTMARTSALLGSLLLAAPLASAFVAPTTSFGAPAVRARGGVEMMAERSKSLPFLVKPPMVRAHTHRS